MSHIRFHILGNVGVDLSLGPIGRLPTWGTEIVAERAVYRPGGAAVNVGMALAGLFWPAPGLGLDQVSGADPADPPTVPVRIHSPIGDDDAGARLGMQLRRAGIDLEGIDVRPDERTSLGLALVRSDGERAFVTDLGALALFEPDDVITSLVDATPGGWLLATGMTLFPRLAPQGLPAVFDTARRMGLHTALDTGWEINDWPAGVVERWLAVLPTVDLFLPNQAEAEALTGLDDPARTAVALQEKSGGTVIVKVGAAGVWSAAGEAPVFHPTRPVEILDATGAGDVFAAALLYGLDRGDQMEEAIALGQRLAGEVLENRRTFFPSIQDLTAGAAHLSDRRQT